MRPNTYNPDCDFDPDQRDLDASIKERNKTESDATERARRMHSQSLANDKITKSTAELMVAFHESENALLKKKLAIAMRGLDEYDCGDECTVAFRIKAEIEEVK